MKLLTKPIKTADVVEAAISRSASSVGVNLNQARLIGVAPILEAIERSRPRFVHQVRGRVAANPVLIDFEQADARRLCLDGDRRLLPGVLLTFEGAAYEMVGVQRDNVWLTCVVDWRSQSESVDSP